MEKPYKRNCDNCGKYYEGSGKKFCSHGCFIRFFKLHGHTVSAKKKISKFNRGKVLSEEHKRKISIKEKGKIVSFQTKKKLSENHADVSGKNNPFYGKKHKKKAIEKNRNAHIGKRSTEMTGINNPMWIDGRSYKEYPPEFNNTLKEKIRKRDGYICQLCGKTQEEEMALIGKKLSVHHIDYNRTNCELNNLITLCLKCNTIVNMDRLDWIKFFNELLQEK